MRKHAVVPLAVFAPFLFCVLLTCLILVLTGTATLTVSGFAVDDANRLYVGTTKGICVYEEGKLVDNINPKTSRTYMFTITEDDNILLSTSTKIYIMDLNGNVLETKDDSGADVYNQLSYKKRKFTTDKGDVYKLSNFGWTKIVKNSTEVVYQIDALSFSVKVAIAVCGIALIAFIVRAFSVQKFHKKQSK